MGPGVIRDAMVWALPALLFVALHAPALDYDLVWTDEPELVEGTILRPSGRILRAFGEPLHAVETGAFTQPYYRPLQVVLASLLADRVGREPRVFRIANLSFGMLTAGLFAWLALQWTGSRPAALLAAGAWAAHPVGLEIYVWAGGLSAAQAGAFLLASLAAGHLAVTDPQRPWRIGWGLASCVALALALLSKENAAIAPGLQLAASLCLLARARRSGEPWRERVVPAAAWIAAQAALVGLVFGVIRPVVLGGSLTGATPLGGAWTTQWLTSVATWPAQLLWLALPLHSTTSDVVDLVTGVSPAVLGGAALALGSLALFVHALRRGHTTAAFALAWVWIAFLPGSGLVPLVHARSERNLFFAAFGAALLLGAALPWLRARAPAFVAWGLALLAVAGLAQRSLARQPDWRSSRTLFERDVGAEPRYREGRMNLVLAYVKADRLDDAKAQVDALLDLRGPTTWSSYAVDGQLLDVACRVNRAARAESDTVRALDARPPQQGIPQLPGFYHCYARSLERVGDCDRALPIYERLESLFGERRYRRGAKRCRERLDPRGS